ncbi:MAG: thioesterase domain-containing protein [bacterium]
MGNNIKLFCVPFSGGNAYSFAGFRKYLPDNIELCNLELPGRGKRICEPLLYTIEEMTEDLYNLIKNNIDGNYAIFGHSLGSLLGYTLAKHITDKGENLPLMLFLSGNNAPSLIKRDDRYKLTDNEFINMLREMEGTPEELLADKSFIEFFLPVIKADFQSIANYTYTAPNDFLNIPITVMYGSEEDIDESEFDFWQLETNKAISMNCFYGGHFYIFDQTEKICNLIVEKLKMTL